MNKVIEGRFPLTQELATLRWAIASIEKARRTEPSIGRNAALLTAAEVLVPISDPEFRLPRAAYEIARVHFELAKVVVVDVRSIRTVEAACDHLAITSAYLQMAAAMKDSQHHMIPQLAMERLAALHEKGYLNRNAPVALKELEKGGNRSDTQIFCTPDFKTAFAWREQAAEDGYAISQWKLGVMLAKGQGCYPSYRGAFKWMSRAQYHLTDMSSEQKEALARNLSDVIALLPFDQVRPSRKTFLRVVPQKASAG